MLTLAFLADNVYVYSHTGEDGIRVVPLIQAVRHVKCINGFFSNIRATHSNDSDSLGRVRNIVESELRLGSVIMNNERIEGLPEDDKGSEEEPDMITGELREGARIYKGSFGVEQCDKLHTRGCYHNPGMRHQ